MFAWFANLLDKAPDKELGELLGSQYRSIVGRLGLSMALFMLTFLVLGVAWWSGTHIPETQYLQLRPAAAGQPQQTQPLYTFPLPSYSPKRLQEWVSRALSETLTFNFTDVDQQLAHAGSYYTPGARQSMQQAIAADKIVETVKGRRLAVALTPTSPPFVIKSYSVKANGQKALYWDVEAPVILNYTGASHSEATGMRIYLRVKQVPTTESPDGLAIAGFYARVAALK